MPWMQEEPEYAPGELIVKMREGKGMDDVASLNAKYAVSSQDKLFSGPAFPDPEQELNKLKNKLANLGSEHEGWYWQTDKESQEYKDYLAKIEKEKEALHKVIDIMPEQKKHMEEGKYGATMRLGAYPCALKSGTIACGAYQKALVEERHRHRYEINSAYVARLEDAGLVFSGASPDRALMEIAELPRTKHPFMLGTQFHPEFQARPLAPHPLFTEFLKAAIAHKKKK